MIRQVWKFFCSVKLTVVLFVLILIPSIIGTIILQNAPDPNQYLQVYGATWDRIFRFFGFYDVYHDGRFIILLALLGLNTLACTINRSKLRWNRVGTLMTHFGLLFVLLGALAGAIFGVKGFMIIREGETTSKIGLDRASQRTQNLPFELKLVDFILDLREQPQNKLLVLNAETGKSDSFPIEPGKTITLPRSRWSNLLSMLGVSSKDAKTVSVQEFLANASTVTSITEGPEKTGMAAMEFKISGDGVERQAYVISQIERPYTFGQSNLSVAYLALENQEQAENQIKQLTAVPTTQENQLEIALPGKSEAKCYPARIGSTYKVEGADYSVEALQYVPDFLIGPNHEIMSRSNQPNNPALQVRITGPAGFSQQQWLFAKFPSMHASGELPFEMKFKVNQPQIGSSPLLLVLNPKKEKPLLAVLRDGKVIEKKNVEPGVALKVKDMPYTISISRFLENANVIRKIENRPDMPSQPAIKVALAGTPEPFYLWEGNPVDAPGYKMVFQREPVINHYYSVLQVINGGHTVAEKKIAVNDPLKYGGYTFYQASYDSENSSWSGLQVKEDPGVGLVYIGFILMTLGMIIIFYVNPLLRKSRGAAAKNDGIQDAVLADAKQ